MLSRKSFAAFALSLCLSSGAMSDEPVSSQSSELGAYEYITVSATKLKRYQKELTEVRELGEQAYIDTHMGELEAAARDFIAQAKQNLASRPTPAYSQHEAVLCAGVLIALDELYSRENISEEARLLLRHAMHYSGYKVKAASQIKRAELNGDRQLARSLADEVSPLLTDPQLFATHLFHYRMLSREILPAQDRATHDNLGAYCDGAVESVREYLRVNNRKYDF